MVVIADSLPVSFSFLSILLPHHHINITGPNAHTFNTFLYGFSWYLHQYVFDNTSFLILDIMYIFMNNFTERVSRSLITETRENMTAISKYKMFTNYILDKEGQTPYTF